MAGLPEVTRAYFEILAVRELRKVGFDVIDPRVHRRTELPEADEGFLLELVAWLQRNTWRRRALIACRRQRRAVGREAVDDLAGRLAEAKAEVGLLFAHAAFEPEALTAASERGIALLELVDARVAFDTGGWGAPGHYPPWLPAHLTRLVDRDPAGQTRTRLLEAGQANIILERLKADGGVP
jgi:restriction endonuclease